MIPAAIDVIRNYARGGPLVKLQQVEVFTIIGIVHACTVMLSSSLTKQTYINKALLALVSHC